MSALAQWCNCFFFILPSERLCIDHSWDVCILESFISFLRPQRAQFTGPYSETRSTICPETPVAAWGTWAVRNNSSSFIMEQCSYRTSDPFRQDELTSVLLLSLQMLGPLYILNTKPCPGYGFSPREGCSAFSQDSGDGGKRIALICYPRYCPCKLR